MLVWVYRIQEDGVGVIDQVLTEFNPDMSVLADKYPDAIYFYAGLVTEEW